VKDTRPPRVFGAAQPADAILGVGTDLKLRFNEAIAGNYLDEDNNFQILGMTNATGITTGTSLHFNEEEGSNAYTEVDRSLTNTSFTLDMIVRPSDTHGGSLFKTLSQDEMYAVSLVYGGDGTLTMSISGREESAMFATNPGALPAGIFSRVVAVYDNEQKTVRFYIGTQEQPLSSTYKDVLSSDFVLSGSGPFRFGVDGACDMLEARVWLKALTLEEIAATNMKYLTGYERDLLAYYRMNEGRGETVKDYANGATLYLTGTTWNLKKGISLAIGNNERVVMNGNLLSRSANQDESVMLWFKTTVADGTVFSAGRMESDSVAAGLKLALTNGALSLYGDNNQWPAGNGLNDGEWHHVVLTVDRTRNNVSLYVDGELKQSFSATAFGGINGAMYLGGNGFAGHIDDVVFFEQALPKYLIQSYDNASPVGDEMGLMGYLPFEKQVLNPNGILELVFSPNDQRIIRDPNGKVVEKITPLLTAVEQGAQHTDNPDWTPMGDKVSHAPTRDQGQLTKMKFDWAFNDDELLINLNMEDREINKQTIYLTVRDVEDLDGNPMASPVSWVAFVDRNALKWDKKTLRVTTDYDDPEDVREYITVENTSGRRHQYTVESLPDWLTVDEPYGTMSPLEEMQLRLTFKGGLPVGVYNDQIYLTDEDGLAEPLSVEYTVKATCPWSDLNSNAYDNSMSLRGQVLIEKRDGSTSYDTDEEDIIAVFCDGEMVGKTQNTFDNVAGTSYVYLTIYGNAEMTGKLLSFKLWQRSTGRICQLKPATVQRYQNNAMRGFSPNEPVKLTLNANAATQQIAMDEGWNWISWNLYPNDLTPNSLLTYEQGFMDSDIVKSPSGRQFSTFHVTDTTAGWVGTLANMDHQHMFMVRTSAPLTLTVEGRKLTDAERTVTVYGKCWSSISYLLDEPTSVREALADYYDKASVGDVIKSKDAVAVFTEDGRWEGSLQTMRPGGGYLFRRLTAGDVTMRYVPTSSQSPDRRKAKTVDEPVFTNPQVATNMTMVATVKGLRSKVESLHVYVDNNLAGIAQPQIVNGDTLYFVTIQSDQVGDLRFELNGEPLAPIVRESVAPSIRYCENDHLGSVEEPVVLQPTDDRPYKILENNHVVIIRNNERYDVTGKKLQ